MTTPLPYARPTFVERQRLLAGGYGLGTVALVICVALGIAVPAIARAVAAGPWHAWPQLLMGLLVAGGAAAVTLAVRSATVVQTGEITLAIALGPVRLWRRTIPLARVQSCQLLQPGDRPAARTAWRLPMFRGTSVLKENFGDLYVMVRGNRPAVVLTLAGFKNVVIGSTRPHELVDAVRAGLGLPPQDDTFAAAAAQATITPLGGSTQHG